MEGFTTLFSALIDDCTLLSAAADVPVTVNAHQARLASSRMAALLGPLVIGDARLGDVSRLARPPAGTASGPAGRLAVEVVASGGAGGLLSLGRRDLPGVAVVAVESTLRDLDDLAGNAARVVTAAAQLPDDVAVFVEIPYARGWERAVAEVEAGGRLGAIRAASPDASDPVSPEQLCRQLTVLIEADLPFKTTYGPHRAVAMANGDGRAAAVREHGLVNLIAAVDAVIEGADETATAALLRCTDPDALVGDIVTWDESRVARVRRRLVGSHCSRVADLVEDLVRFGLLRPS